MRRATKQTAVEGRRRPPRGRRILKTLLRSTFPNFNAAAARSTMLNREISACQSELGALSKRQLQMDTNGADERDFRHGQCRP